MSTRRLRYPPVEDYFAARTAGSILFAVRKDAARIWDWRGHGFSPDRVRELLRLHPGKLPCPVFVVPGSLSEEDIERLS